MRQTVVPVPKDFFLPAIGNSSGRLLSKSLGPFSAGRRQKTSGRRSSLARDPRWMWQPIRSCQRIDQDVGRHRLPSSSLKVEMDGLSPPISSLPSDVATAPASDRPPFFDKVSSKAQATTPRKLRTYSLRVWRLLGMTVSQAAKLVWSCNGAKG